MEHNMDKIFEIHITGDETIHQIFKNAIKTIAVQLLRPDGTVLRTEHMTSHLVHAPSYESCKELVDGLVADLVATGVRIVRTKIECPYYEEYLNHSCYIESHFVESDGVFRFPTSRNARKTELLATDREYDRSKFGAFRERYKDAVVELCLFDDFVDEDKDWFDLY
jgi:hypothetical protein